MRLMSSFSKIGSRICLALARSFWPRSLISSSGSFLSWALIRSAWSVWAARTGATVSESACQGNMWRLTWWHCFLGMVLVELDKVFQGCDGTLFECLDELLEADVLEFPVWRVSMRGTCTESQRIAYMQLA